MNRFVIIIFLGFLVFAGCKHDEVIQNRYVTVFFSPRSQFGDSFIKSTASEAETLITKIIMYGTDEHGNIVETFPVMDEPSLSGIQLSISMDTKSLYAIANPSANVQAANPSTVSDLMNLTGDFSNPPQSPFLMSGMADVIGNTANIELIRAVAKIVVNGDDEFQIISVTVKNTPDKGFVFPQSSFVIPPTAIRKYYPANTTSTTVYVAENIVENPTTLTVKGLFENYPEISVNIDFKVDKKAVPIERNKCYQVKISPSPEQNCTVSITISEWDDVEVDTHYFEY